MMDSEQFKDALQQCLEGAASPTARKAVVHAARSSPELRRILAQTYAFDAMLKGLRHNADSFVETALDTITHPEKQEELAKKFSKCPSGQSGGDLGEFARGRMVPAFEEAAFELAVGETSGPVRTRFGFHLIHRYK